MHQNAVSALQSVPHQSTQTNNQLHPTGRRWKRRRKQQTFLPSPHRSISPVQETALIEQLGYLPPNICRVSATSGDAGAQIQISASDATGKAIDTSSLGVGRSVAIQSYPLLIQQLANKGSTNEKSLYHNCQVTPFPTMYWLSDTHISRAISELERQGYVRDFQLRLENDEALAKTWLHCHAAYALERWELLSDQDREWLLRDDVEDEKEQKTMESMRDMIKCSGVAGTDYEGLKQEHAALDGTLFVPSVKCLHSHYAHYRSQLCRDTEKVDDSRLNVIGVWTHELLLDKFPGILL